MSNYVLHCFAQSGNAYKCALMLELCGADWSAKFVDFFKGGVRSPEFLALNPMGEVPVLEHGDIRLSQSGVILDYLAGELGKFGPENAGQKREVLRWLLWDNHKLTGYTATLRFLIMFAKTGETPVTEFLRARAKTAYGVLDRHLSGRDWVAAPKPTIADLSICGYLYWPDEIGVDWRTYPNIEGWLERIKSLSGWRHPYDLMPGHKLASGDA